MPQMKWWNGSAWVVPKAVKTWNGSQWVQRTKVKYWNGSAWVDAPVGDRYVLKDGKKANGYTYTESNLGDTYIEHHATSLRFISGYNGNSTLIFSPLIDFTPYKYVYASISGDWSDDGGSYTFSAVVNNSVVATTYSSNPSYNKHTIGLNISNITGNGQVRFYTQGYSEGQIRIDLYDVWYSVT